MLHLPHPVISGDEDVNRKWAIEGATDAQVEHASAQYKERALEPILLEKVFDED